MMLSGASQSCSHMTDTRYTQHYWRMTHYQDLTSFSFLFSIPTRLCLKFWKANKQNTAKSSVAFIFLSFRVFSGGNYLASQQAAFTHVLSCSSCGYNAPLSLLTACTHPVLIRCASDNDGNKDEASVLQVPWRTRWPWKARCPVTMPSCSRTLRGFSAWRHGEVLLLGSSWFVEKSNTKVAFLCLITVSWTVM